jgi:hypothetical protein
MKTIIVLLALAVTALAQTNNLAAVGMSYQPGASPAVAGTGMYAKALAGTPGTYVFTVADALPLSVKPFTVITQFGAGIAQKIFAVGRVTLFVPTSAGVSVNGSNTGWAWTGGGLASITTKRGNIMPNVRVVKSSVAAGQGYTLIAGVMFGWEW